MKERKVDWVREDNPSPASSVVKVQKIGATDTLVGSITSEVIEGYYTHWWGGRTVPHVKGEGLCSPCLAKIGMRWAGFIHLAIPGNGRGVWVELTLTARDELKKFLEKGEALRGLHVSITREGRRLRAPLQFQRLGRVSDTTKLIRCPELRPTLDRLWGKSESV